MLNPNFLRHYQTILALFPKGNKASSFNTSPYKKRKLSPSLEPAENIPSTSTNTDPASPPQLVTSDGPTSTSSPSPPRYLPSHLAAETGRAARSPTPEPSQTDGSSPVTACAGLTIDSDGSTYGSSTEGGPGRPRNSQTAIRLRGGAPNHRNLSPAKRRLSAMVGGSQETNDGDIDVDRDGSASTSTELGDGEVGQRRNSKGQNVRHKRDGSVDMLGTESANTAYQTPHSGISSAGSSALAEAPASSEVPPIDDQIREVKELHDQESLKEGRKGFVVSKKWLSRVLARGSNAGESADFGKEAKEGSIGPVDNSGLEFITDIHPDGFKDECGGPFVPLKPGLNMGDDFEVLPESAWDLIIKWYGRAQGSPVITRFCHNTSPSDTNPNLQYELYPPIFTILKLPDRNAGMTSKDLKDNSLPPAKLLASRHDRYQSFLKQAKDLADINIDKKVRTWRILGGLSGGAQSGMITPAQSRSSSPAPGAIVPVDPGSKLILDANTFAGLQLGSERELIDAKDETANEKYNGRSSLDFVGLRQDSVILLEEQVGGPGGGEWVSDGASAKLKANGIPIMVSKSSAANSQNSLKVNASGSRGSSPGPGMMTRGRQAKSGRVMGTIGLNNLGNTCYMNSALQCLRNVEELTKYFIEDKHKKELNITNPLAHNGNVAKAYAALLHEMYNPNSNSAFGPRNFKNIIGKYGPSFSGYQQQDSQEFLLFLLDGLQEDLNRIHKKPYIEKPDSTDEMVNDPVALQEMADKCWDIYKKRNDSVITDLFAGMYKSTVICPVCDKVSIIFDPFNNLTLQLPIENVWSKPIIFFPLHDKPVLVAVDIDKNASFGALKEHVAAKFPGTDPKKTTVAEIYRFKFYKIFDDNKSISEETIVDTDTIAILELEDKPTNWPPPPKTIRKKSYYTQYSTEEIDLPDDNSPVADKMMVSLFHRHLQGGGTRSSPTKSLFGAPSFIVLTREEARDHDAILRKVLAKVATMTTRNFLAEEEGSVGTVEDSDMVLMNAEDADTDSKVNAESLESEDDVVDVSMKDSTDRDGTNSPGRADRASQDHLPKMLQRDGDITEAVRKLFDMKFIRTENEMVPLGWQSLGDEGKAFPSLASRLPSYHNASSKSKQTTRDRINSALRHDSPQSSDEDIDDPPAPAPNQLQTADSDEDSLPEVSALQAAPRKPMTTFSRKGKQFTSTDEEDTNMQDVSETPLLRLGEALVLDWTTDGYEALFGGTGGQDDEDMRGAKTWEDIPAHADPQLEQRRLTRANRRKNGISLADCLDEFGKPEILSENDAWYCPRCKEHRRASKKFELWKSPDILVIHLKRFSAQGRFRDKLDVRVDFPIEGLDLSSRVAMQEEKSQIYDLFAVDNHYGGLGGGHYTAFAQNFIDKSWWEYNDSIVSKRSNPEAAVVTSAAYLLFYRRRSSEPLGGPFFEHLFSSTSEAPSDSQPGSRSQSPSGEGKRLDGASSRNGSSSALRGVGAAHQPGGGGLAGQGMLAGKMRTGIDDDLPAYSAHDPQRHVHTGVGLDEDEGVGDMEDTVATAEYAPIFADTPNWSFGTAHQNSPDPGVASSGGGGGGFGGALDSTEHHQLFGSGVGDGDGDSNRNDNEGSATSTDYRNRMDDFDDDPGTTNGQFGTPPQDTIPMLEGTPVIGDYEGDDGPVAEVKLSEGEEEDGGDKHDLRLR